MVAYQAKSDDSIYIKFASVFNGSFTVEPQFEVAKGVFLGASQGLNEAMIYYRQNASSDVLAKYINTDQKVVREPPITVFSFNESSGGFGAYYTSKKGFVAWGTSAEYNRYTVRRETRSFPENPWFDTVTSVNDTNGVIVRAAMDEDETIVFVLNRSSEWWTASYRSGASDSFFNEIRMTLDRPIPLASNVTIEAIASNAKDNFMLLASDERDNGSVTLHMTFTNSRGSLWESPLVVGSFVPSLFTTAERIRLVWAERWVVILNTVTGYQWLQMIPFYPFEFEWRAAFRRNNAFGFVSGDSGGLATLVVRESYLLIIGEKETGDASVTKLAAVYCSPVNVSSSSVVSLARSIVVVVLTVLCLLLA